MTREDKMQLWQERLQHQKDSELTIAAWCDLHQIAQSQFYYWQKKLTATPSEPDSVIVPVSVPSSPMALVVETPGGYRISSMTTRPWRCCASDEVPAMIPAPTGHVYLATGSTDMRKSINTLGLLVEDVLALDPVGPHWFVFCNCRRDKLKILQWDTNGFWLHYRRLESGKFQWPMHSGDTVAMEITARQQRWLLDGLNWQNAVANQPVNGLKMS